MTSDEHEVTIGMESEFGGAVAQGLHRYVRLVIEELGLRGDAYYAQLEPAAHAYVALDRALAVHPDRDVALIWNEQHGWALALETNSSEDLVIIAYQGVETLPSPRVVAAFAREALANELVGHYEPVPADTDLAERLAAYAILRHDKAPGHEGPGSPADDGPPAPAPARRSVPARS